MSPDDIFSCLFSLFDSDESGSVDLTELAEGLRKIHGMPAIQDVMDVAEDIFDQYDLAHQGVLKLSKSDSQLPLGLYRMYT
jgi:Ca2+-binding EF-hand superfamily protein